MKNKEKSVLLLYKSHRTKDFQVNEKLDTLIGQLKFILEPVQKEINKKYTVPEKPIILIIGCPRSGSTLLSQILAFTNQFSYPTNFLSRFAYAPVVGAMIQEMIFNPEYDFRKELLDVQVKTDFNSSIGKTNGALSINEFFHFWRRFFPNYDSQYLSKDELQKVNLLEMIKEIAAIEAVFNKPFLAKGQMMQFNLDYFSRRIPKIVYLYIKRDALFNMQSVLLARRKYYGTDKIWRSVKPKEYPLLKNMDPYFQVAGQIYFTEKTIEKGLAKLDNNSYLTINYEDLCSSPKDIYASVIKLVNSIGGNIKKSDLPKSFRASNYNKLDDDEIDKLMNAYKYFKDKY